MDTVVLVLMLLTAFNFLLKQTFWKLIAVGIITAICAVFAGLMWPYAIEQSKTQIANWLSNQLLMLDTSVLLSVEVCIQMAYAMLAVHVANDYPVKPRMILMYRFLRWFPGLLIFPVLFSGLVYLIFAFPGKRTYPLSTEPQLSFGSQLTGVSILSRFSFSRYCFW